MDFLSELPDAVQDQLSRLCPRCYRFLRVGDWPTCPHDPVRNYTVEGDACDMVIENMTPEPMRFTSKAEWRRKMGELGLVNMVRHVPKPGSDKSDHTQRWV